jgi:signal transduction histidine kinase
MKESELYWTCEYRFRRADGSYAWVFDRGALVFDASARATRILGVMEDISRDRELESRMTLSSRLAAVGSLASGIAHEINNPLAWVTSNLGFALEELKKLSEDPAHTERCEEIAEALDDSQTGANRIAQIVSDLRTFAHADSDKLAPVAVKRVVEGALTMANNELKHRARVVRRLDDLPLVMANESRLGHALLNLLLNAAWSAGTPGSSPEVLVSTQVGPKGQAVIEISDNGTALSADVLPHLFDPFYSARPGGEGLGLGLAVTHSIIAGFGGVIEVESTPTNGTVFRVVLPAVAEEQAPARLATPPTPIARSSKRSLVVVIDDEPSIITAIDRMLTPPHEVVGFTDGRQALAMLRERRPDLILCDVMMPEVSGAEVWARLQAEFPELLERVVLLTGGAFTREAEAFIERCPAPVLDKPFTPKLLRDTVERIVGLVVGD